MDFMTGLYLSAALTVLMAGGVTWFLVYWANQPGGVIEIGKPRWVMPKSVVRAMHLQGASKNLVDGRRRRHDVDCMS